MMTYFLSLNSDFVLTWVSSAFSSLAFLAVYHSLAYPVVSGCVSNAEVVPCLGHCQLNHLVLVGFDAGHSHYLVNHLFGHRHHLFEVQRRLSLACGLVALEAPSLALVVLSSLEASVGTEACLVDD
jgi:hypothetical protein